MTTTGRQLDDERKRSSRVGSKSVMDVNYHVRPKFWPGNFLGNSCFFYCLTEILLMSNTDFWIYQHRFFNDLAEVLKYSNIDFMYFVIEIFLISRNS